MDGCVRLCVCVCVWFYKYIDWYTTTVLGADDGDDLEMYGSEVTANTQQTSYSFEVCLYLLYSLYYVFNAVYVLYKVKCDII